MHGGAPPTLFVPRHNSLVLHRAALTLGLQITCEDRGASSSVEVVGRDELGGGVAKGEIIVTGFKSKVELRVAHLKDSCLVRLPNLLTVREVARWVAYAVAYALNTLVITLNNGG